MGTLAFEGKAEIPSCVLCLEVLLTTADILMCLTQTFLASLPEQVV